MKMRMAFNCLVFLILSVLAGCAWVRNVVDQAAGFPVLHVFSDVKNTANEIQEEKQEERVEELSAEYEEFVRTRDAVGVPQDTPEKSVLIEQGNYRE